MEKKQKIKEIQILRRELNNLISNQIIPKREKLNMLLNEQAELLCPFKTNEIITLNNGKKGIITEILYHSIDYDFNENVDEENNFYSDFVNKLDEIEYKFAYNLDDKEFSITWSISGFRMKNKDTEIGKISFGNITPINYIVDVKNKSIKDKPLKGYMDLDELTIFKDVK